MGFESRSGRRQHQGQRQDVTPREYLAHVHTLHCVVCLNCYGKWRPAHECHHLEFVRGEHSDYAVVPVCGSCHEELHEARRRAFYLAHKLTDTKLLAWTIKQLMSQDD